MAADAEVNADGGESWPPAPQSDRPYSTATFGRVTVEYDGDWMIVRKPMLALKAVTCAVCLGVCVRLGMLLWAYFNPSSPLHAYAAAELAMLAPLYGIPLVG
jgi:hypothetical protein